MRVLLFSDLHLDTPFCWAPPALARTRRASLRRTLQRIVELAATLQVDAIACGGDLYEHERFSPDTGEFLRTTFASAERPVLLAPGNHDWLTRASLYTQTAWTGNVTVFQQDRFTPHELAAGFTVWGAAHCAPANTDNFLDGFHVNRGGVNVALFHGSETGGFSFQDEGKRPHAPFAAAQIPIAGFAHALLGHYHMPSEACWHTYPGNPEPLAFGETGERGAVLLDIASDETVTRTWHAVADTTVSEVTVDLSGLTDSTQVADKVAAELAGAAGVVRVTLTGEVGTQVDVRPGDLMQLGPHLASLLVRTGALRVAYDWDAIEAELTVRGQFVRDVLAAPELADDERRRVLVTGLRALDGRSDLEVA
jgi:DNA repair protein SbcD/Mre11